jgi:Holliday junction resolvasome RuvABC endonuclease subunit
MQMDMLKFKDKILIEDYSMGSKGKVFHIAENTEVLQYNLYLAGKEYHKIPPTSLKKWATGKGNSDKEKMYEKFLEIEGVDLKAMFGLKKADSPLSDIVDSYFLAKYAFENL